MKSYIGKSSVWYFSFLMRENSSAQVLRGESVYYNSYYKHCIISNKQFFQTPKSWEDGKIIQLFYFDSGIDSIDILFIVSIIGMFTESGIRRRNKAIFFKSKVFIERNIISCYPLNPSNNDVFVAEGFKLKANIGNNSVRYFSISTRQHSSSEKLQCLL